MLGDTTSSTSLTYFFTFGPFAFRSRLPLPRLLTSSPVTPRNDDANLAGVSGLLLPPKPASPGVPGVPDVMGLQASPP
eukprot:CAMPEP_0184491740 /NCGR_PEP_ID=MMETSP0113_2-20130426/21257_1 /TAXON_ID=91329 /ORGANISM="Norrisiella sphaerica, Strain BC52" /LENGTH=77 /DNA_ID=CAMNT_0026876231 /DNA_START=155 /DNA_END=384 /DNA_ORIENTATION=-